MISLLYLWVWFVNIFMLDTHDIAYTYRAISRTPPVVRMHSPHCYIIIIIVMWSLLFCLIVWHCKTYNNIIMIALINNVNNYVKCSECSDLNMKLTQKSKYLCRQIEKTIHINHVLGSTICYYHWGRCGL